MASNYNQVKNNLKLLKLGVMAEQLDESIDYASRNQLSFVDTLLKLTNYQIDYRETNAIRSMVKVANFQHYKEMMYFDFSFQFGVNRTRFKFLIHFALLNKSRISYLPVLQE